MDMVVVDMEDTASSSHTSSQHHLQEDTVSNTVADMELRLHPLPPLPPAPTLLSSRLLMLSTTATNTALPLVRFLSQFFFGAVVLFDL